MTKFSIEVRSGAARFDVAVRAESLKRAVSIMGARYPGRVVKVKFPAGTNGSFVSDRVFEQRKEERDRRYRDAA